MDYLEFRLLVAGMAAELAATRATDTDRRNLTRTYNALLAAHDARDTEGEIEADSEFHMATYAACHNTVMEYVMRQIIQMLKDDVFYERGLLYGRDGVRQLLLRQHKAIYDGIMSADPAAARIAAERHILYIRDALQESRVAEQREAVARRRITRDGLAQPGDEI